MGIKFKRKLEGGSGISSYDKKLGKYTLRGAFSESGNLNLSGGHGLGSYDKRIKFKRLMNK